MPAIDDPRLLRPQCDTLVPVQTVHKNPWFTVRNRGGYYTIEYNMPQVLMLPIVDNEALVMVRVKRPVITDATLELPAGGVDEGESPREAARREFREETGLTVPNLRRFEMLPPLVHMPRSPCMPYIFRVSVTRDEFCRRGPHDREIEKVERLDFGTILDMIISGEIYVGLHIAIVMRFLLRNGIEALVSWAARSWEPLSHAATKGL